ncbi:MAG TPA: N-acetylmuramoyl-L-alanine amidase [Actinomycetota bacterium]|nr:N-acetylmuramoyl-L-alanine amidase [Actinomycetota bacterium]
MRLKCATWEPAGYTGLGNRTANKAVVFHTNGFALPDSWNGSLLVAWEANAKADYHVGSHLQVAADGSIFQYVDSSLNIGHAYAANPFALGVETEDAGDCSKPWNAAQVASLLAICREVGVPAKLLKETASDGVGWHRQYPSWNLSNHSCPCDARQAQVTDVIIPGLEDDMGSANDFFDALDMTAASWAAIQMRLLGQRNRVLYDLDPVKYAALNRDYRADSLDYQLGWDGSGSDGQPPSAVSGTFIGTVT